MKMNEDLAKKLCKKLEEMKEVKSASPSSYLGSDGGCMLEVFIELEQEGEDES